MSPFVDDMRTDTPCKGCGGPLNAVEAEMYGDICNFCATVDWERLKAWRAGRDDPDLDARYSHMKRRRLN